MFLPQVRPARPRLVLTRSRSLQVLPQPGRPFTLNAGLPFPSTSCPAHIVGTSGIGTPTPRAHGSQLRHTWGRVWAGTRQV